MCTILSIVIVTWASSVAALPSAGRKVGTTIPIYKRPALSNTEDGINFGSLDSHVMSINAKILQGFSNYEKNTGKMHPVAVGKIDKRQPDSHVYLTNHDDGDIWYGVVEVGSARELFGVVFDTASSNLIIPSTDCNPSCNGHERWNPNESETSDNWDREFEVGYLQGYSVSGNIYTDVVFLAEFFAFDQVIGAATRYPDEFRHPMFYADGVMGMGFQSMSLYKSSPVFQTLVSQEQVTNPVFSFKLASVDAEVCIGGVNEALFIEPFTYVDVEKPAFWQVNMDNVQANGNIISNDMPVIIDTASNYILGPPSHVSLLHRLVDGTEIGAGGNGDVFYTFHCNKFPTTVSLSFGGTAFTISPASLNTGPVSPGASTCYSGIVGHNLGLDIWIIGRVFLQDLYTTFDVGNSRVGFAQLNRRP